MMKFILVAILTLCFLSAGAQQTAKKPLDNSVFDSWQSIANSRISNDGKWVLYAVKPEEGDAELVITDSKNKSQLHIPRADTARFTSDSKFAVLLIKPFF